MNRYNAGDKFGEWTIIKFSHRKRYVDHYLCKCSCGKETIVNVGNMISGRSTHCVYCSKNSRKHGMSDTRPYSIWKHMLERCTYKPSISYKNYGAKGIKPCEKWLTFEGFWEDMKEGYLDNLTLDRIDNNLGYNKENCKWSTMYEQAQNKSNTVRYKYKGKMMTLNELMVFSVVNKSALRQRLKKCGWGVQKALHTPSRQIR